jgi:hypothetical protein
MEFSVIEMELMTLDNTYHCAFNQTGGVISNECDAIPEPPSSHGVTGLQEEILRESLPAGRVSRVVPRQQLPQDKRAAQDAVLVNANPSLGVKQFAIERLNRRG